MSAELDASHFAALGEACFERREIREALQWFTRSLDAGGDPVRNHLHRWNCAMMLGDFDAAWREGDRIDPVFGGRGPGEYRCVVIRCLRGLGDSIQFLRYAALLRRHCEHLTVQAPRPLLPLLALFEGIDSLVPLDEVLDGTDFDLELECSNLPYLFRATPATIPFRNGYVHLPHALPQRATAPARKRVGLVWASGESIKGRSVPLLRFFPLLRMGGFSFFSLQRGPAADQMSLIPPAYLTDTERGQCGILHTVRVIRSLDLVITVDTMLAHLAGAMGKPVWTLLPHAADWRWMLHRSDTPWYASMRLFRQPTPGDWPSVISELREELAAEREAAAFQRPFPVKPPLFDRDGG